MVAGHNSVSDSKHQLEVTLAYMINSLAELEDILKSINITDPHAFDNPVHGMESPSTVRSLLCMLSFF
jgi:hypothetical protein